MLFWAFHAIWLSEWERERVVFLLLIFHFQCIMFRPQYVSPLFRYPSPSHRALIAVKLRELPWKSQTLPATQTSRRIAFYSAHGQSGPCSPLPPPSTYTHASRMRARTHTHMHVHSRGSSTWLRHFTFMSFLKPTVEYCRRRRTLRTAEVRT